MYGRGMYSKVCAREGIQRYSSSMMQGYARERLRGDAKVCAREI